MVCKLWSYAIARCTAFTSFAFQNDPCCTRFCRETLKNQVVIAPPPSSSALPFFYSFYNVSYVKQIAQKPISKHFIWLMAFGFMDIIVMFVDCGFAPVLPIKSVISIYIIHSICIIVFTYLIET